jgi:hypothetical protein
MYVPSRIWRIPSPTFWLFSPSHSRTNNYWSAQRWKVHSAEAAARVARWHIFEPKILIWVNFGGLAMSDVGINLWPFGLFYCHLVFVVAVWYNSGFWGISVPFWYVIPRKIWQPWRQRHCRMQSAPKSWQPKLSNSDNQAPSTVTLWAGWPDWAKIAKRAIVYSGQVF